MDEKQLSWNQKGPSAISGFRDGPVFFAGRRRLGTDGTQIATLALPAGAYVINAKLLAASLASGERTVFCRLRAEHDVDYNKAILPPGGDESIALQVVHRATVQFGAAVSCRHNRSSLDLQHVSANWVKITAITVDDLTNTDLTPHPVPLSPRAGGGDGMQRRC